MFKYPLEPSIDYIKRIIGLPGDRIIYRDKSLYIEPKCKGDENCNAIRVENVMVDDAPVYYSGGSALTTYEAHMGSVTHQILLDSARESRCLITLSKQVHSLLSSWCQRGITLLWATIEITLRTVAIGALCPKRT